MIRKLTWPILRGPVSLILLVLFVLGTWYWWGTQGAKLIADQIQPATGTAPDLIARLGQTGDIFGGVNALFAAMAFIGVAVAAYFQYRTLQLVERNHRIEVFEPLFFKLLDQVDGTFSGGFVIPGQGGKVSASTFAETMIVQLAQIAPTLGTVPKGQARSLVATRWGEGRERNSELLGPYFRSLFQVFDFIDRSELDTARKIRYSNIARSSMSSAQLRLLMLNCCTDRGEEFLKLVEKYGLLKYLPRASFGTHDSAAELSAQICAACFEPMVGLGSTQRAQAIRLYGGGTP